MGIVSVWEDEKFWSWKVAIRMHPRANVRDAIELDIEKSCKWDILCIVCFTTIPGKDRQKGNRAGQGKSRRRQ